MQAPHVSRAVTEKTVVRVSGDVGYQTGANTPFIPITGQQAVPDNAYVVTRASGVADLVMPDSSVIRIAQAASIQVGAFHDPGTGENTITIYNGSFRFKVQHPAGGVSNYKFVTPTSQIAVRGTEGLGTVKTDVTQVSTTVSNQPNDVQVAPAKMQTSYFPTTGNAKDLRLFLRADPTDEMQLANMAPEPRLVAQVQVVFTALAQGFTATVTVNGVVVGQFVLSSAALGVGGTLSSTASAAAGAGSSAVSAGTSAAASSAAGTAVVTGAAAAAAAGGLAAAAASANSGVTASTPQATASPTPSPTASVVISVGSHARKGPETAPSAAPTPPPLPVPMPPQRK
ncbi:MAG TPA: FecR domain-containing protein [Candidatus Baltobacteraceae bacterium]|jgi:hypothetical protein